jgi:hypothetical protein
VLWMDHPLRNLLGPVIAAAVYVLVSRWPFSSPSAAAAPP